MLLIEIALDKMPGKKKSNVRLRDTSQQPIREPVVGAYDHMMGLLMGIHEQNNKHRVSGKTPFDLHLSICFRSDEKFTTAKLLRAPTPLDLIDVNKIDSSDAFLDGLLDSTLCIVLPNDAEYDQSFCRWHSTDRYAVPHLQNGEIVFAGIQVAVSDGCECIDDCDCTSRTLVTSFDPLISFESVCAYEPVKATYIIYSVLGYIGAVRYLLKLYPRVFSLERIAVLHKSRKQMFEYCINCFTIQHCPAHHCTVCSELDEGKQLYRTINSSVDAVNHMELVKTIYRNHLGEKIRSTYYQKPRAKN